MAEVEVSSLEKLQADPILGEFIGVSKSETEYVEAVLAAKATAKTYAKLQEGIVALEKEIQSQVSTHHEELLAQVNIIRDLEDMLLVVNEGIDTLDSSLSRVQQQLQEPYEELVQKTAELRRMLAALEILRRTLRFSFVCSQLRRHVGAGRAGEGGGKAVVASSRELPKAASCLLELEQIRRNSDLSGVELVEREMEWIVKVRNEVQTRARQMLVQGLETQNQSEVAQALQVFHNLQALAPTVSYTRSIIEKRAADSIHDVLDFSALERAHTGTPGAAQQAAWRAALWTRMEKLVDVLHQCSVQVWHLQRILQKMKEQGTRASLLDLVVQEDAAHQTVTKKFWAFLAATLASELENAVKKSQFIDATFVTEFPKLLRVFTEFLKRLQAHFEVKQGKDPSLPDFRHSAEDKRLLLGSLAKFETAFLTRTLSRLVEPINRSMPPNSRSVPSLDEVAQIAKVVTTELDSANSSHHLSVSVSKCVAQALGMFVKRCEAVRAKEDDAFTLSEKASSGQVRNAMLFNSVHQLHTTLGELSKLQTASVQEVLGRALEGLDCLSRDLLDPLFARTTLVVERSMLTMHQSQYGIRGDGSADEERSKYMQILQRQLHVFQTVALSPYTYCPLLAEKIKKFVERVLVFFVRQASLVRPLSDAGKLRLTGDMAQLELALGPLRQIKSLGEPYVALRALRPFLFREVDEVCTAPELKQLRGVDVMHQLFSRGPDELKSPHQLNDWSLAKYSAWLDKAAGKDIWSVIQRSLDAYAAKVNERGESHYDPIYPVMRELGPKLLLH